MSWIETAVWLYLGGVLGTALRHLQEVVTMPQPERERFDDLGHPALSIVVQAALWPLFAIGIIGMALLMRR